MSEKTTHSPLPWATDYRKGNDGNYRQEIWSEADGRQIAVLVWTPRPADERGGVGTYRRENAEIIVKAVNEYAALLDGNARLRSALEGLVGDIDAETCWHDNTHHGGFWIICDDCGERFDDQSGVVRPTDSPAMTEARRLLEMEPPSVNPPPADEDDPSSVSVSPSDGDSPTMP